MSGVISEQVAARLERLLAQRKRLDEQLERLLSSITHLTPPETAPVVRVLRWFNRETEELAGSAPLKNIDLPRLQRMFRAKADDPMYDCFEVTTIEAGQLQVHVDVPIELEKYHYFVEADALP